MKVNFAGFPPAHYSQQFLSQFLSRLTQVFSQVVSSQQEAPQIILNSPDGKLWKITVSNAGAIVVAPAGPVTLDVMRGSGPP